MKTAKSQTPFIEAANFGPSIEIRCVCVCVCVCRRQAKKKIKKNTSPEFSEKMAKSQIL